MQVYRLLKQQIVLSNGYKIVPIRYEDRYTIMQWRNEQMYHLRQNKPLTKEDQDRYFKEVVAKLFDQEKPEQLLFSYIENDQCIGYGGLVHINWIDKNAEISFMMDTVREKDEFQKHWTVYIQLIEELAFKQLGLHKIYTYAFDLRPHLYEVLEHNAFGKEAILKEHCLIAGDFKDVVIHSKKDFQLSLRRATSNDLELTYQWASNRVVRKYALGTHTISFDEHSQWFIKKLSDSNCLYYIAEITGKPIGSIRFDVEDSEALISYLILPDMHGKGLGKQVLYQGVNRLFKETDTKIVKGIVLENNEASVRVFESLGYKKLDVNESKITYAKERL